MIKEKQKEKSCRTLLINLTKINEFVALTEKLFVLKFLGLVQEQNVY